MFFKIENFVENNKLEQVERLAGRIPNYEEYMHIRYGVTGVRMFTLLLEYISPLSHDLILVLVRHAARRS